MSNPFFQDLHIRSEHANRNRWLRTSSLFRIMQETAVLDTDAAGFKRDRTMDRGLLWVLSRQYVHINRMPAYDETVRITTEAGKMMHIFYPRLTDILLGEEVLVTSEALWLLMDENSRSVVFPEASGIMISGERELSHLSAGALRAPADMDLFTESRYHARFSQTDVNGHIGNTSYFDIMEDLLPEDTLALPLRELEAEYRAEIRPAEDVIIRMYTDGKNNWYSEWFGAEDAAQGKRPPKPRFRAVLRY